MLIIAFALVMLEIVLMAVSVVVIISRIKGELWKTLHKIVAINFVLLNSILTVPIFNVSIITLYCDAEGDYYPSDYTCYDLNHIILCVLAVICMIVVITGTLFNWLLFYDRDPTSRSFLGVSSSLYKLGKVLLKIIPPVYFVIDSSQNYQNVYIFVALALVVAYIFFFRMFSIHNSNQSHFYAQYFLEGVLVWFAVNTVMIFFLDTSAKGGYIFIQTIICSLLFGGMLVIIQRYSTKSFFMENLSKEKIKKQNMEKFMFILLDMYYSTEKSSRKMLFIAIRVLNINALGMNTIGGQTRNSEAQQTSEHENMNEKIFHIFFKKLNEQFIEESNSVVLKILHCNILYSMKKKVYSIHKIIELSNDKLSLGEEFLVYRYNRTYSLLKDQSDYDMSEKNSVVENYYKFVNRMNDVEREIEECTKNNIEYWKQLTEDSPSFAKIKSLSFRYHEHMKKIQFLVSEIENIFPANKIIVYLYYQFLINVGISIKEKLRISEKISSSNTEKVVDFDSKNQRIIKFKQNQNLGAICLSTSQSDFCHITSCNSQIQNILGFEKSELIGSKVIKIMPTIYHDIHDGFVQNYVQKLKSIFSPSNKNVFGLKKNGRISEIFLSIKIIPHEAKGFELVGFVKRDQKSEAFILINLDTLDIEGVSEQFEKLLNKTMNGKKINFQAMKITQIFPNLKIDNSVSEDEDFIVQLKILEGTQHLIRKCSDRELDESKATVLRTYKVSHYQKISVAVLQIAKHRDDRQLSIANLGSQDMNTTNVDATTNKLTINNIRKNLRKQVQELYFDVLPLEHKLEDFITISSNTNKLFFFGILLFIFFIVIVGSSVFKYQITSSLLKDINEIYEETQISKNISVYQGKIMIYNQRIVNPFDSLSKANFDHYQQQTTSAVNDLENELIELIRRAGLRKGQKLEVNQANYYDFQTSANVSKTQSINQLYLDGIFTFISLERKITKFPKGDFQISLPLDLSEAYYYTMTNSLELFPNISEKTDDKYTKLFENQSEDKNNFELQFAIIKTIVCFVLFLTIFFIVRKFDLYNQKTLEIYRKIHLEDICIFQNKCRTFLKHYQIVVCSFYEGRKRREYLENVFPKQSLIGVIEESIAEQNGKVDKNESDSFRVLNCDTLKPTQTLKKPNPYALKKSDEDKLSNQNEDEDMIRIQHPPQETPKQQTSSKEVSIKKGTLVGNVKLTNYNSMKEKYIVSFVVLFIQFLFTFGVFALLQSFEENLVTRRDEIKNLGSLEKTVLFSFFYGYKSISDPETDLYSKLFKAQFEKFYSLTSEVYPLIGDPRTTLRQLYTKMEALGQIVKRRGQILTDDQILYLNEIEQTFFKNVEEIIMLLRKQIKDYRDQVIAQIQMIQIIKLVVQMLIGLILCRIIQVYLFSTVGKAIKYSTYMLQMIPISLIHRKKQLRELLFPGENYAEQV